MKRFGIYTKAKLFICVCIFFSTFVDLYAQRINQPQADKLSKVTIRELEDIPVLRDTLDHMFSLLEKDRIPTGLLKDNAVELTDLSVYDGVIRDDNLLNAKTFEYILRSIRSAAVKESPFAEVSRILEVINEAKTETSIPIGIAAYKYNFIKSSALSQGLIKFDGHTGRVIDQYTNDLNFPRHHSRDSLFVDSDNQYGDGVWQNPYSESIVFASAPCVDIISSPNVSFIFSNEWFFSNLEVASLEFDAGIGQGYQLINLSGESYSVYYGGQGGLYETKVRVTLSDGSTLESHDAIYVLPLQVSTVPAMTVDYTQQFISSLSYNGLTPTATVSVKYANTNFSGTLKKPLIVAEGFDPFRYLIGSDSGFTSINDFQYNPLRVDYDVVYIDWNDSCAPIEVNADIMIQVIQWVNLGKKTKEGNIVLGYSMGGLIARYALCEMEEHGLQHETAAYVSYDTPHLGAHIPLGYVYFVRDIYNCEFVNPLPTSILAATSFYLVFSLLTDTDFRSQFHELMALSDAPSVKQMLYYYVNQSGVLDNSVHEAWQSSLLRIGFPKGSETLPIRKIAISNGGRSGSHPSWYLSLNASFDLNALWTGLSQYINLLLTPSIENLLLLVIPHQTTYRVETHIAPCVYSNQEIYSTKITVRKKFLWIFNFESIPFEHHVLNPFQNDYSIEAAPSSYYNLPFAQTSTPYFWTFNSKDSPIPGVNYGIDLSVYSQFRFVPTASALCYRSWDTNNTEQYNADFSKNVIGKLDSTPFNTYYVDSVATQHISNLSGVYRWLQYPIQFHMDAPQVLSEGDSISVSPSYYSGGSWSSSNSSVAFVDVDGIVHTPMRGKVTFHYSGKDPEGRPYHFEQDFFSGSIPQFSLSSWCMPFSRPNPPFRDYIVRASPIGNSGDGISPTSLFWGEADSLHFHYTQVGPNITWSEDSVYSYRVRVPLNKKKYVLFRADYNGVSTRIARICCENPVYDGSGFVLKTGEILPLDNPGVDADSSEAGSSNVDGGFSYRFGDSEIFFSKKPSTDVLLKTFLVESSFVQEIKRLKPWGNRDFIAIPFHVVDRSSNVECDSCIKLMYRESIE